MLFRRTLKSSFPAVIIAFQLKNIVYSCHSFEVNDKTKEDVITRLLNTKDDISLNEIMINDAMSQTLMRSLYYKTKSLSENRFLNKNGVHCNLVQGPEGIGKTTILRHYTTLCNKEFSNVIPVYMSYNNVANADVSSSNMSINKSLLQVVAQTLLDNGIDCKQEGSARDITAALEYHNKYVIILVDDIDHLYRIHHSNPALYAIALRSLHELSWLGGQVTGRYAVYLCGSSSFCPLLITCRADRTRFPRLNGAPYLNNTKYPTIRLPIIPYTNLAHIKLTTQTLTNNRDILISDDLIKLLSFYVGSVPRDIDTVLQSVYSRDEGRYDNIINNNIYTDRINELYTSQSHAIPLYNAIIDTIRIKNKGLGPSIISHNTTGGVSGVVTDDMIMTSDWYSMFQPLDYSDILTIWHQLCKNEVYTTNSNNNSTTTGQCTCIYKQDNMLQLQQLLYELCDRNLITFVNYEQGLPIDVYPLCASQVYIHHNLYNQDRQ